MTFQLAVKDTLRTLDPFHGASYTNIELLWFVPLRFFPLVNEEHKITYI